MNNAILIAVLLIAMSLAYRYGTARSSALANGGQKLAALPGHYGLLVALWCGLPALAILILYSLFGPAVMQSLVTGGLPPEVQALPGNELAAVMRRVTALADGQLVAGEVQPFEQAAATRLGTLRGIGWFAMVAVMAAAAAGGLVLALRRFGPQLRARHQVERIFMLLLIVSSAVAILTTIGIVLSMVGEALRFFSFISPVDFFFGTTWNPRFSTVGEGGGSYGLLPLLWGTLMISIIAMLIAIPVGLMIAIYMSQYAHPRLRAVAKPVIEVLAGIPTIVYGFFALTVVGPFFSEIGALLGVEIRATSALTAGVVMGIMIIPFVSSLSDDVITQVPRSMRDGSLALGATSSETVRKVVLRAALPGIVGAGLLAVSRAIGETMIVVLAAGNAPILHANPLEAVSTVTVTIVNQLTGDIDFASPQSLVAFALGLTLFVITLGLNIVALAIVRKYREQYE